MKIDKFLIYIAVIAVHVGIVALLVIGARKKNPSAPSGGGVPAPPPPVEIPAISPGGSEEPAPSSSKSAQITTAVSAPSQGAAATIPPPPQSTSPAPSYQAPDMPAKYTPGFYKKAPKQMGAALAKAGNECTAGLVIDVDAHAILWEKNPTKVVPIASLTKLLTAQMLMDRIDSDPTITLQTKIKITKDDFARTRMKPLNSVFLGLGEEYTLQEYLKAMLICSANDCAYIVGKYLGGGNLDTFVKEMNTQAATLGLADMKFINPNGLPLDSGSVRTENMGSAMDIAFLAERSLYYPEIMKWAGTPRDQLREDKKNPFDLNSTNKLLRNKVEGITGLKTGYTATAGFCIAVTCEREKRRVIVVLMGVPGADHGARRDAIARQLLDWAYKP